LSLVSVVCCQVEVSASGWSLVQRSPTECGVSNWLWSWSLDNEEALAHWGLLRHWRKIKSRILEVYNQPLYGRTSGNPA
jgi:hypothetical protein